MLICESHYLKKKIVTTSDTRDSNPNYIYKEN